MSFPRYPAYKDSGVEWLGEVPAHWETLPLKYFASFSGGGTPSRDNLSYWNGDIPWVSPKDMKSERINGAEECITESGLRNSSSNLLPENRVLMVVRSGILQHTIPVAINDVPVALNQDMKAILFDENRCSSDFFFRWVQGLNRVLLLAWAKQGATVESIEQAYLANTIFSLPPKEEQGRILSFIDHEVRKIDRLISEQQKLIALLKEKRQAVISHAVTKGLDPNVKMKDSGIEWLGEVPGHWEVLPLKYFARFSGGGTPSRENLSYWDGDIPWVSPKDMKSERIIGAEECITEVGLSNSSSSLLPADRVLMVVRSGILQHTIPVAINDVPVALNQDMKAILFKEGSCLSDFFFRWVQGLNSVLLLAWAKQGATVESIEQAYLANTVFPLPPIEEQKEIIKFINQQVDMFDELTAEAVRGIELLKERRSALISAAVTGKIDVRGAA